MKEIRPSYKKFISLAKEKGLTPYRIAKETGVSQATLTSWKNGAYVPKLEKLSLLADFLGEPISAFLEKGEGVDKKGIQPLPIIGEIACGAPIFAEENYEGYAPPCHKRGADFCLIAKGDSMIGARIFEGDLVYIRKQSMVSNGEIAAVLINDSATLKRVYYYPEENKLVLSAENPKYEPLVFVNEELSEIEILGKAVAFQSEVV